MLPRYSTTSATRERGRTIPISCRVLISDSMLCTCVFTTHTGVRTVYTCTVLYCESVTQSMEHTSTTPPQRARKVSRPIVYYGIIIVSKQTAVGSVHVLGMCWLELGYVHGHVVYHEARSKETRISNMQSVRYSCTNVGGAQQARSFE